MNKKQVILADTRVQGVADRALDYQLYLQDALDINADLLIRECPEAELHQMAQLAEATENCLGLLILRDPASLLPAEALEKYLSALSLPAIEVFLEDLGRHQHIDVPQAGRRIIRTIYGRRHRGVFWAAHFLKHCRDYPYQTIAYGETDSHIGDLLVPAGDGPFPVCMLIHGGFWRDGYYRDSMHGLAADLAKRGIAAWNVEYRRVGPSGGGYPESHRDIFQALSHLEVLAKDFPLDLDKAAVVGHSAGGYLAIWASSIPTNEVFEDMPRPKVPVQLGISLAGVTDLDEAYLAGGGEQAAAHFLKGAAEDPELRKQLSAGYLEYAPFTHLILAHGTLDDYVPVELSEHTYKLLKARNIDADLVIYPDWGHNEFVDPESTIWKNVVEHLAVYLL